MSQPLYLPHTVQQGPPHHCFCWFTCQAGKKMAWGVAVFPWSRVGRCGGICTLTKKRPVNTSSCFQLVTTPRDLRPLTPGFAFHVFQMVNLFAKYVHLEIELPQIHPNPLVPRHSASPISDVIFYFPPLHFKRPFAL